MISDSWHGTACRCVGTRGVLEWLLASRNGLGWSGPGMGGSERREGRPGTGIGGLKWEPACRDAKCRFGQPGVLTWIELCGDGSGCAGMGWARSKAGAGVPERKWADCNALMRIETRKRGSGRAKPVLTWARACPEHTSHPDCAAAQRTQSGNALCDKTHSDRGVEREMWERCARPMLATARPRLVARAGEMEGARGASIHLFMSSRECERRVR